jgi:SAM-dependent methyltransferase
MSSLQKLAKSFKRLPIHPQWLLGQRTRPEGIESVSGLVLDIGAADRWIEKELPKAVEYIALDYPATGHGLYGATPTVFADASQLPFRGAQFDAVICLEVIEHVPAPFQVFSEISRVLKTGGEAWISMPFLYPLHDAPFDFQRFTEFGLTHATKKVGLEVTRLKRTQHSIRTAGLLFSLAIAGGVATAIGWRKYLLIPLALVAVTFINLSAWALSFIWPNWQPMSHGFSIQVRKT